MPERIEEHLRAGGGPDGGEFVIRGRPLDPDGLMRNARQTSERYSFRGEPLVAISAEVIMPDWPLERILSGRRLRTRVDYAAVTVKRVTEAGYQLLASFDAPHYSVVWQSYTDEEATRLSRLFEPAIRNPYYVGRSR